MLVRTLAELEKLGRIKFPADESFRSARFVTAADALGFSYNENRVKQGTDLTIWLKHHWEANYIVSGEGEVIDLKNQQRWPLSAGVLYVVGPNDRHRLHLTSDECHVSIFRPPLRGDERFDSDGSYEPSGPIEKTDRRMFVKSAAEMRRAGNEIATQDGQVRTIHLLTRADGVGFGLSHVCLAAGAELRLGQHRHGQASHVVSGFGEVTDSVTGQAWELGPSSGYSAGPEDQCRLKARTDMFLLNMSSLPFVD